MLELVRPDIETNATHSTADGESKGVYLPLCGIEG